MNHEAVYRTALATPGLLITSVSVFQNFYRKLNFFKDAVFHWNIFGLSSFGHNLGVFIVNTMISIKKYSVSLFMISFIELLKCTTTMILNIL